MAIGNVTPDSFYAASRLQSTQSIANWARESVECGADILDIGGCSTRPNSTPTDEESEWNRVAPAIEIIRTTLPDVCLSLDTFRVEIARRAIAQFGPMIINDISGGCKEMYALVRDQKVPYIWTLRGKLNMPDMHPEMDDIDLILDPGIGFIGSVELDYECLRNIESLQKYHRPILIGVSRKSMVYKTLGLKPETSLAPTQALQLYALEHGANILRTHDVTATRQTIELYNRLCISYPSLSDSKM